MWAFVVHRWHHVRCGAAAYNIPAPALVSTCLPTLLPLRAIPWCAYVSLHVPTPFRVLFVVVPMQKETCVAGGPLPYSSPCSLVGSTRSLVSVGGAGLAFVASLVCAAWHDMVTYLRGSLFSLLIFSCDACLVAVMLLAWV